MANADTGGGRTLSVDLTASSTRNLLLSIALICGGLWGLVVATFGV